MRHKPANTNGRNKRIIFRFLENHSSFLVTGIVFRALLEISYRYFVAPLYEYAGFELYNTPFKYIESWIIYITLIITHPCTIRKPSDFLTCLAIYSFLAPLLVFYAFNNSDRWALYFVLIQFALMSIIRKGPKLSIVRLRDGKTLAASTAIFAALVATTWIVASVGMSSFNLNMAKVYEYREVANNRIYSGIPGYIVSWTIAICGPYLLLLSLRHKRYFFAILILVLHTLWFGLTSHKAVLFYPLLVGFTYYLFRHSRALSILPLGYAAILFLTLLNYYATESMFLSSMFTRRFFFLPSQLTFTYFEYFNDNPHVYWSNSFLSWLIQYPYDTDTAQLIGAHMGNPDVWANNSFFSTGYMHAGIYGVVAYGLIAGIILLLLDSLTKRDLPFYISLPVIIVPFHSLIRAADLTTTLLTHGLAFGFVILYLISKPHSRPHPTSHTAGTTNI